MCAAGVGFLADSYDLWTMGPAILVMSSQYPASSLQIGLVTSTALVGAMIGQFAFGILGDRIGRRKTSIISTILVISGAAASAFLLDTDSFSIYIQLVLLRLLLGIGVGAEYPLSAAIASEAEVDMPREMKAAIVFSMQGIGAMCGALLMGYLVTFCPVDYAWRIALSFGAVPSLIAFFLRCMMAEPREFSEHILSNARGSSFRWKLARVTEQKRYLTGTMLSWFFFDIAFYGNGLFAPTIAEMLHLGSDDHDSQRSKLIGAVWSSAIIASIALPGYFASLLLVKKLGMLRIQLLGFAMITVLFFVLGIALDDLVEVEALFIVLYGATFFFSNFGPNTTTYLFPAVIFPSEMRSTCSGLSAAAGKLGAIAGALMVKPLVSSVGVRWAMMLFSFVCLLGGFSSLLLLGTEQKCAITTESITDSHIQNEERRPLR